ncbi:hypothetical protein HDU76_006700 [Blyttiomyces sp. JEL0837]|nr:hypothetical protein HDU76_006700 [Blyttiomyces sp. JEL0837]
MKLDLETRVWTVLNAGGIGPKSLTDHTAVVYGRNMYVFGGDPESDENGKTTKPHDNGKHIFHSLDLDTYVWERLPSPGVPYFIQHHTALVYEDEMIVFGGGLRDVEGLYTCSNRLFIYNFTTQTWSEPDRGHKSKLRPAPRAHHMAWISGTRMIIYGGESARYDDDNRWQIYHNDMIAFDLETKTWLGPVKTFNGDFPMARAETMAACYKGSVAYLFGGYCESATAGSKYYDDGLRIAHVWERDGEGDGEKEGGEENDEHVDMTKSKTRSGEKQDGDLTISWIGMKPQEGKCPIKRAGCTLTMDPLRRRAILVGGYNGFELRPNVETAYSDVWELHVTKRTDAVSNSGILKCGGCGKKGTWRLCAGCGLVPYCGTECQKMTWPDHKVECKKARENSKGKERVKGVKG